VKAVAILNPGPQSRLALVEEPIPTPGAGEVLIKVKAAGVNRGDLLQRQGRYPPPPGASPLPGLEVAGEVIGVGANTPSLSVGSRVCALLTGGGYAEYVTAPSTLCFEIPQNLSDAEAAALPEALFTVWDNVFRRGRLVAGETLLIQGGTSGIGMLAIPLARHFGAQVIATAGSEEKCLALERQGAIPILYRSEDLKSRVNALTQDQGVDVILDLVGGPLLGIHLELLREEGRLVLIAVQGGYKTEVNLLPVLTKRLTLTGSTLRSRSLSEKSALAQDLRREVWPLIEGRHIQPTLAARFPLEEAESAHALMTSSLHIGKIILEVPW
jgi:putative PIG3 family NAD(P)H quinone oxidoreductase